MAIHLFDPRRREFTWASGEVEEVAGHLVEAWGASAQSLALVACAFARRMGRIGAADEVAVVQTPAAPAR